MISRFGHRSSSLRRSIDACDRPPSRVGRLVRALVLAVPSAALVQGCGGSGGTSPFPKPSASAPAAQTPTVTVTAPSKTISDAQNFSITIAVTGPPSASAPAGSVIFSSGNYASFPTALTKGDATINVPAGVLAAGTDTFSAKYMPSSGSAYLGATGSTAVAITASGVTHAVTATARAYATTGHPFTAQPLADGNVLVSVTTDGTGANANESVSAGIQVFSPSPAGLSATCIDALSPALIAEDAFAEDIAFSPNGVDAAVSIENPGVDFLNLAAVQTCSATDDVVAQGTIASAQGTFATAITPDGKYAFVANEYGTASGAAVEGNIGVVRLQYDTSGNVVATSPVVGQISTGGAYIPGVTLSPDGTRLYVTSEVAPPGTTASGSANPTLAKTNCTQGAGAPTNNGLLTVIDVAKAETTPNASAIIATVDAGCSPVRAVETADQSVLWVAARGDDSVLAFSTGMLEFNASSALLGSVKTGGTAPVGLKLFSGQHVLAVANSNRFKTAGGTQNMTILNAVPVAPTVLRTVTTGLFPRNITVGPDDATLYLTNYDSGQFQVVSTSVQ